MSMPGRPLHSTRALYVRLGAALLACAAGAVAVVLVVVLLRGTLG